MVETRMILQTRQTPFRAVTGDIWYFTVRAPAARSVWRNRFSKHSIAISWKWNRKHLMKAIIMGCSTVHREELAAIRQGNYPAIKTSVEDFGNYDIVFVGYPIWYGSMGTPMQTFLHNHASKLAGKRIALFASSGSSGISASVDEARTLCSGATFTETLLLTSSTLSQMGNRIRTWLENTRCESRKQSSVHFYACEDYSR